MDPRFNSGDRRRLKEALGRARAGRQFRRLQAVLWVAEGRSVSETARLTRVSRASGVFVLELRRVSPRAQSRTLRASLVLTRPFTLRSSMQIRSKRRTSPVVNWWT